MSTSSTRLARVATRIQAAAERGHPQLDEGTARARLRRCDGPVEAAIALEALVGGRTLQGYLLGLDTHRTKPPKDAYDEWLDPALQRAMVQIAFGGAWQSTYWLDDAGWVHEIGPLDRLRPVAERVEDFLEAVVDARGFAPHHGLVALAPFTDDDAAQWFGAVDACPIGPRVALWSEHARSLLEESPWLARIGARDAVVVSAPSLDALARPLADLVTIEPALALTFLDAAPRAHHDVALVESWATTTFRSAYSDAIGRCVFGLDARSGPAVALAR